MVAMHSRNNANVNRRYDGCVVCHQSTSHPRTGAGQCASIIRHRLGSLSSIMPRQMPSRDSMHPPDYGPVPEHAVPDPSCTVMRTCTCAAGRIFMVQAARLGIAVFQQQRQALEMDLGTSR